MNDKRNRKKEEGINVRWAEPLCPAHIYAIICTCMYAYSDLFANNCNVIFMVCNSISHHEKGVEIVLILALTYHLYVCTKQLQEGI